MSGGQHLLEEEQLISAVDAKAQLQKILLSPLFRNSRRHQRFLTYLVSMYLEGRTADIKERCIGSEVFDRRVDYEVSVDPIVRVAAADLRKRLALYYANVADARELRIELPTGRYVPLIHWPHERPAIASPEVSLIESVAPNSAVPKVDFPFEKPHVSSSTIHFSRWKLLVFALAIAVLLCGGYGMYRVSDYAAGERALTAFWQPVTGGDHVLVLAGTLNSMMNALGAPAPNETWYARTKNRDHLDAHAGIALLDVGEILGRMERKAVFKVSNAASLEDLRSQPVVLIGGLNNAWGMRLLNNMQYRIIYVTSTLTEIIDTKNPKVALGSFDDLAPMTDVNHSFCLITRMRDPLTNQNVISLAGLGSYGTAAGAEYVSSNSAIAEFARSAPSGWQKRDLQIVIETDVVNGMYGPPRVIATRVY